MEAVFQDCIREVRAEGRTVLLSSHILAEVEALCDRVTHHPGRPHRQSGTLDELRQLTRTSITAETDRPPRRAWPTCPACTGSRSTAHTVRFDVDTVHLDDGDPPARRRGRAQPREPSADARGAVPPPLRRRAGRRPGRDERPARRREPTLPRHRAARRGSSSRRDRVRIVVWIAAIVAPRRRRPSRASRACTPPRPTSTQAARGVAATTPPRSSSTGRPRGSTPSAARSPSRSAPSAS